MTPSVRDLSCLFRSFTYALDSEIKGTFRGKSEDKEMMSTWTYTRLDGILSVSFLVSQLYSHCQLMKPYFPRL